MEPLINMKKKKILSAILLMVSAGFLNAQQNSGLTLSLKEAQDYAVQNNKMMITSRMDVDASRIAI